MVLSASNALSDAVLRIMIGRDPCPGYGEHFVIRRDGRMMKKYQPSGSVQIY
jgi:hypothetical protein